MKKEGTIFVFGSNEAGIHGAGAARIAHKFHGAKHGVGFGLQGTSFAIPTKDWNIGPLKIEVIQFYINRFIVFATEYPILTFDVTKIGCGLAGWRDMDIAPLFKDAPINCRFDEGWKPFFGDSHEYWGRF